MVAVWPETSWPGIEPGESQSFQRKRSQEREFVSLGCCCSATLAKEVGGGCLGPDVEAQDDFMVGSGFSPSSITFKASFRTGGILSWLEPQGMFLEKWLPGLLRFILSGQTQHTPFCELDVTHGKP